MSELINNTDKRKETLKELILDLHRGKDTETVQRAIAAAMSEVPYGLVVEVEQELLAEGMPMQEMVGLCDLHSQALHGVLPDSPAGTLPAGHPVHTFLRENRALEQLTGALRSGLVQLGGLRGLEEAVSVLDRLRIGFHTLADVEKHYRRKENLLFPFLEKYGITGPPAVMWGKHDEARRQLKAALAIFNVSGSVALGELQAASDLVLKPLLGAVEEMIYKEEHILFPMCLERLTEDDWFEVYRQSAEIGFCLYSPDTVWKSEHAPKTLAAGSDTDRIRLASGTFTAEELTAMLNTLPFDLTFVDEDDTVRYFSQGKERFFDRNLAVLGRKVQNCHPPQSVHIVERILSDFRSGAQDKASFWITLRGKFLSIEYFALRGDDGRYLGTLEVTQDLTGKRALEGEQRLLAYRKQEELHA